MLRDLEKNPFRLLGIPIDSSLTEINREYNRMKHRARMKHIGYSKICDPIREIFPVERTENNLVEAYDVITKMSDERLKARVFWFDKEELSKLDKIQFTYNDICNNHHKTYKHFKALSLYYLALSKTTNYSSVQNIHEDLPYLPLKIKEALNCWNELIHCEEYWNYLLDVEINSGMHSRVTKEEIYEFRNKIFEVLMDPIIKIVTSFLEAGETYIAEKIIRDIKESNISIENFLYLLNNITNPIEDNIESKLKNILDELNTNIEDEYDTNEVENSCEYAYYRFNNEVKGMLDIFEMMKSIYEQLTVNVYDSIVEFLIKISVIVRSDTENLHFALSLLMEAKDINNNSYNDLEIQNDMNIIRTIQLVSKCKNTIEGINALMNEENDIKLLSGAVDSAYSSLQEDVLKEFTILKQNFSVETKDYQAICQWIFGLIKTISLAYHNKLNDSQKAIEILKLGQPLCVNAEMQNTFSEDMAILNNSIEQLKSINNRGSKNKEEPKSKLLFIGIVALLLIPIIFAFFNEDRIPNTNVNGNNQSEEQQSTYMSKDELGEQIDRAQERLSTMETQLNNIGENIQEYEAELNYYEGEIQYLQSNNYDDSYEIDQYNYYIDLYNEELEDYRYLYDQYEDLYHSTNQKIDKYNNR